MPEDEGVEAAADLVDVKADLFDIGVSIHKLVDLQFILKHVGLDRLALSQELRPVADAELSGREARVLLLVGQDHQDDRILLHHVDAVPEIRSQGQGVGVLRANVAVLRLYLGSMGKVLIAGAFFLGGRAFPELDADPADDLDERKDHLQVAQLRLLALLLVLGHFEVGD